MVNLEDETHIVYHPSGIGGPTGVHSPGPVHLACCLVHQAREVTSEVVAEATTCRVSPPSWTLYHGLDGPAHRGQCCPLEAQRTHGFTPKTWSPGTGMPKHP